MKAVTFPYSIAGYDGYLERFLDWLELERVNLVMHDWGAAALAFAQRAPQRVERIVLINALPLFDGYRWHRLARIWRTPVLGELWMGCLTPRLLRRTLRHANAAPLPERELREIYAHLDFGTQRAILKLYRSVKPGDARRRRRATRRDRRAGADRLGRARPLHPLAGRRAVRRGARRRVRDRAARRRRTLAVARSPGRRRDASPIPRAKLSRSIPSARG